MIFCVQLDGHIEADNIGEADRIIAQHFAWAAGLYDDSTDVDDEPPDTFSDLEVRVHPKDHD